LEFALDPFLLFREIKKFIESVLRSRNLGSDSNKSVYGIDPVVDLYTSYCELQKPEEAILTVLRGKLQGMTMLDIGVGAGRTTTFFAPLVKRYVGVDYSENMIKKCEEQFPNYSFFVMDASNMSRFESNYFDFVLFSFNGMDSVDHEKRLEIMREIHRVTKKGGYFCFSAHNLNYAHKWLFSFSKNFSGLIYGVVELLEMRLLNMKTWKTIKNPKVQQHIIINRAIHNFILKTYYITPAAQLQQLKDLKFTNIGIYDLGNGRKLSQTEIENFPVDHWLYYLNQAT
jgi:ubiquinone/menaquinone biosynthesis C-methylase UbiE